MRTTLPRQAQSAVNAVCSASAVSAAMAAKDTLVIFITALSASAAGTSDVASHGWNGSEMLGGCRYSAGLPSRPPRRGPT